MAGMANYLEVLQAINAAFPEGGAPVLPTITAPGPFIPIAPATAPPVPFPTWTPSPELPPPAPQQPIAPATIARFTGLAGPAPTPPVTRQPSRLERFSAALTGFGEGLQGRGPQYISSLREQRERPQREYQQKLDEFNARQSQLGVIGTQAAIEQAETRRRDIQTQADRQADREFQVWLQRTGVQDQAARDRMLQAFELEKEARRAQAEERERQAREQAEREREAKRLGDQYFSLTKNRTYSNELGRYHAGLTDKLSPAAAKIDKRLQEIGAAQLREPLRGGAPSGASAQKALADFEAARQAVAADVKRGDVRTERLHRRKLDTAFGALSRFPGQVETGYDQQGNPQARLRSAPASTQQPQGQMNFNLNQPQPTAPAKTVTMAQIRATAQKAGISEAEAIQRAQAAGFTVTQQ